MAPFAHSVPWAGAHPGDRAAAELAWRHASERGESFTTEFRVWHGDGRLAWVRLEATPVRDLVGRVTGYDGVAVDDTTGIEQRLLLDRLLKVQDASSDPVLVLDRNGAPLYANRAAERLFGVGDPRDFVRDPATRGLLQLLRDQVPRELLDAPTSTDWSGEVSYRGRDGLERMLELDLHIERSTSGAVSFWGGVARDVTERNARHRRLVHEAHHDPLTDLPNRALLLRSAADAIERMRGTRSKVALLFVDLDHLKRVNDSAGHDVGDALIVHVANRLSQSTRPSDLIARIGGDEFVVLCRGVLDEHSALEVAERIANALTGPAMVRGVDVELSVSIGVALAGTDDVLSTRSDDAALALLRNSDEAMYAAKRRGRSRCELYTDSMRRHRDSERRLAAELERALALDQLELVYQPVISTQTGRTVGAEALLRWDHPIRGRLSASQFLHLAVDTGAIVPIGEWVVERACTDTEAWTASGLVGEDFCVHVNVAARQLLESSFVEHVAAALARHGLRPSQLMLDLDEATLADRAGSGDRTLQALRRSGVRISLDDFGVGVSSLTALRSCGADALKLDGAIARDLGLGGADDPVVRALVQLAHGLGMRVVAEWVTSADQLQRLRALGCDLVQGDLVGEAADAGGFADRHRQDVSGGRVSG